MSNTYYQQYQGQYRVIPGAGTYLENQAKAQSAYERAKAQLMAQRQQAQIKAGLNQNYEVDPYAQYGGYQQMLQTQGQELAAANEQAQQRGFFGPGLGNQGESALRYGHAVQALGFKNALADYESQYQAQLGELERQRKAEMLAALQSAADNAFGDWTPPGYDPIYDTPETKSPAGPPAKRPPVRKPPAKRKPPIRRAGGTTLRVM
jgi:hypothetical protein